MARYIDAERFDVVTFQRCSEDFMDGMDYILDMIENAPTEDVVPKSEVEKFIQEIDQIQKDKAEITYLKEQMIAKAKQDVAREIFEEIEHEAYKNEEGDLYLDLPDYLKIKKKYIGE